MRRGRFLAVFRRAGARVGAPGIHSGLRAAEFGEGFLAVVIADEGAVAFEAFVIVADVGARGELANLFHAGVVVDEVAAEAHGEVRPELVIQIHDVLREFQNRVAIDLHDDAERRFVGIHPIEREAFLNVEFVRRAVVEDDFAEEAVDVHHVHLAGNLNAAIWAGELFLAGVILKTRLRVGGRGNVDFILGINALGAAAGFDTLAVGEEKFIERAFEQIGNAFDGSVAGVAATGFNRVLHDGAGGGETHHRARIFEQAPKERRVNLQRAVVLRAQVVEIGSIGQRVLRDEITVAAVEVLILLGLTF